MNNADQILNNVIFAFGSKKQLDAAIKSAKKIIESIEGIQSDPEGMPHHIKLLVEAVSEIEIRTAMLKKVFAISKQVETQRDYRLIELQQTLDQFNDTQSIDQIIANNNKNS